MPRPALPPVRLLIGLGATLVAAVSLTAAPAASASTAPAAPVYRAHVASAQNTFTHALHVAGWAYDTARPSTSLVVRVYADGHLIRQVQAADAYAPLTRSRIPGKHAFALTVTRAATIRSVTLRVAAASVSRVVATSATTHHQPPAAQRVIAVAKRYVGKARYTYGGTSPSSGFDCSGYTQYVFTAAHAAKLPRTAEQQRHTGRSVSARSARAGDLVFYGVPAYHVAIYAGHGMQYAAATERDGIRYQKVWSSSVQYRRVG